MREPIYRYARRAQEGVPLDVAGSSREGPQRRALRIRQQNMVKMTSRNWFPGSERKQGIDMPFALRPRLTPLIALVLISTGAHAVAQEPQSLAGKTVTIYVGFGPGGGYDLYGRVLARHLGRHLPGHPTV